MMELYETALVAPRHHRVLTCIKQSDIVVVRQKYEKK